MKYYIYKTTNIINGHYYVGKHTSNNIEIDKYLGSGKHLNNAIKKYGKLNFIRLILYLFETLKLAFSKLKEIVTLLFIKRLDTYNLVMGGYGFNSGYMVGKNKEGKTFRISVNDLRYISGLIVGVNKGLVTVRDINNHCFKVEINDFRYTSGLLVHNCVGKHQDRKEYCWALDRLSNLLYVKRNDNRFETSLIKATSPTFGKVIVKDLSGKRLMVDISDPRYISGELEHHSKGQITVRDNNGKCFNILKDDPRYLSGELVSSIKGLVSVYDEIGNLRRIDKNHPKYVSGEWKSIFKGTVVVKDCNGKAFRVKTNDPRFLSGLLITARKWNRRNNV